MRARLQGVLNRRKKIKRIRRSRRSLLERLEARLLLTSAAPSDDPPADTSTTPTDPPGPSGDSSGTDVQPTSYCGAATIDAQPDEFWVWHDTADNWSLSSVLDNDSSDNLCGMLTASLSSSPPHGTVVLDADGAFIYTPDPGFVGVDIFQYTASDGVHSAVGTVEITVDNDDVIACDDPFHETDDPNHGCFGGTSDNASVPGPNDSNDTFADYQEDLAAGWYVWNDGQSQARLGDEQSPPQGDLVVYAPGVLTNDVDLDPLTAELICGPH